MVTKHGQAAGFEFLRRSWSCVRSVSVAWVFVFCLSAHVVLPAEVAGVVPCRER